MQAPLIEGYQLGELIGNGQCGAVYRAVAPDGTACAVKVLDTMAVNRRVLRFAIERVGSLEGSHNLLPVTDFDLDQTPYYLVMPLVTGERGAPAVTLRGLIGSLEKPIAWDCLEGIARAVGVLHKHGLVHCNLHPGNVFLVDNGNGHEVFLTDYAQGLMGGVHSYDIGAALPYASPEQLASPENVFEGAGLRWDVYSFGALAFLVLEGRLPRGQAYLEGVEELRRTRVGVPVSPDIQEFLRQIREEPIVWSTSAESELESRRREVIERCLSLEASSRFSDVREVRREFQKIDHDLALAAADREAAHERKRTGRNLLVTRVSAVALAALFGWAAWFAWENLIRARSVEDNFEDFQDDVKVVLEEKDGTIGSLKEKVETTEQSYAMTLAELESSQDSADQLFSQLVNAQGTATAGGGSLEESQLRKMLRFYQEKLNGGKLEVGGEEELRALLNIAQIEDRLGMEAEAYDALILAGKAGTDFLAKNPDHSRRFDYSLDLAATACREHELRALRGDAAGSLAAIERGCFLYSKGLSSGVEAPPEVYHRAAKAQLQLSDSYRVAGSLDGAGAAASKVGELLISPLPEGHPLEEDRQRLMAEGHYQRGMTARALGAFDDAISAQMGAVEILMRLVDPENLATPAGLPLAKAYTELGELVGAHIQPQDAVPAHKQAVEILTVVLDKEPSHAEAALFIARNYGELALHERDEGKLQDALDRQRSALELLDGLVGRGGVSAAQVDAHRAIQYGNLADLLGYAEKHSEAVESSTKAVALMDSLLADTSQVSLTHLGPNQLQMQLGKLLGGLGYHLELEGDKEKAVAEFSRALGIWKKLEEQGIKGEADSVAAGISWTEERLSELGN